MKLDLVVRAPRVVTPLGEVACDVGVKDGVIVAIDSHLSGPVLELARDEVLMPGLVDTHVHVNEPGRTEWEGFTSVTRAAAAGGVTTIVDMPLNSIPATVDVPALDVKRKAASGQCFVDVGFWGGAVPGNVSSLRPLHDAGAFGFKCFLLHSGVEEFPPLSDDELLETMLEIASFDGLLIVHAEDRHVIGPASGRRYTDFLSLAATAGREPRCRAGRRPGSADRLPSAHPARLQRRRAADHRRVAGHRRDLPALPDVHRRGDRRRRHRVQVLPAHPGGGEPRAALGRPRVGRDRPRRLRPLAGHRGHQAHR